MTVVLGGRVVRESATSLTSGSQKPIGSHLLHQPPMLVRSAPSHLAAVFTIISCEVSKEKKSGEPMPGVRRATACWWGRGAAAQLLGPLSGYRCCAGPRGRRAATGASPGNTAGLVRALAPPLRACGVDPQSFRSLPRARTRCGSAWFCAAPPISGVQPLGALAAEGRERATDRRAWPVVREDTRGRVECHVRGSVTCFLVILRAQPNVLAGG